MVSVLSSAISASWSCGGIASAGCRGLSFCDVTWLLLSGPCVKGSVTVKPPKVSATGASSDGPSHLASLDTVVLKACPHVVQHLAVIRYDDGTPRRPGRMFVETVGAFYKLILKDQQTGLEMILSAPTLDDVLALADLMLASDTPPWQPDPFARGQQGSGKKK